MPKATQSVPFATVAAQVVARLSAFDAKVVVRPDVKNGVYLGEAGVRVAFGSPQPSSTPGAGTFSLLTVRPIQVWVFTVNLLDRAGEDGTAASAHWATEDGIVNALIDRAGQTAKIGAGRGVFWTPGGDELSRQVKTDPGQILSVLTFGVEYPAYTDQH